MMGSNVLKDDAIDFKRLETELSNAVAGDEKYQRENDAKFRAIRQKVASYDEFRDIVLASHLRPLDKKDKKGGMRYQGWNTAAFKNKDATDHLSNKDKSDDAEWTIPNTSAEFDKIWRRTCKTPKDRYHFLVAITPERLGNILKTECPLGQIIIALSSAAVFPKDFEFVLDVLVVLSKTKRFALTLGFLESDEQQELSSLLETCNKLLDDEQLHDSVKEKYSHVCTKYSI